MQVAWAVALSEIMSLAQNEILRPFHFQKQAATFLFLLFLQTTVALPTITARSMGNNYTNGTDRLALMAIKSEMKDPRGVMTSWGNDSLHFCQWQGITCSRRHKRVTILDLSSNGLEGSVSPYIGNLSFLREVRLMNNTLSGRIPPEVGRLFRLQKLSLNYNSLQGEIPANLSHCSNLMVLDLGFNQLVGKIPIELSSLSMLEILILSNNSLTGGIPLFIGNLTSLINLFLADCHLGGSIPDVFCQLKNLRKIGFGGNNLVGTIPSSIYNLSLLNILSFSENQIQGRLPPNLGVTLPHLLMIQVGGTDLIGSLPPSISNCSELQIIDAADCGFSGKIAINFGNHQKLRTVLLGGNGFGSGEPDELKFIDSLSNCSRLHVLDLFLNQLTGVLPTSLGNFSSKFHYLSLAQNYLFGNLPSSIGNLFGLTFLALAANQFTGRIPVDICNLQNLQKMLLWENNFSGNIPACIGNLSLLFALGIDDNKLQGPIPSSIGNCQKLISLSLSDNNLSGSIPRQLFRLSLFLVMLNLNRNNLSGSLPPEVGNLKNLNQFLVGGNHLSGELPSTLGSCTSLELLDLSRNFFQGSIPFSLSSLRALQVVNLSNNNFSGQIPKYLEQIPLKILNLSFNSFEGEVSMKGIFANASAVFVVGNNRLCGGMPELLLPKCRIKNPKGRRKLSLALTVIISIVSALVAATMVSFLLFCLCVKKRKDQSSQLSLKKPFVSVSYEKLLKATEGFSSANLIGVGSFASVYKGTLEEEGLIVAVKVLNLARQGSTKSFIAECEALRNVRHINLIKVITSCSSIDFQGNDFKAIVYEFMPNGSLEKWLHSSPTTQNVEDQLHHLDLLQRLSIAIDIACALDYLHHQCGKTIIHCDIKPSNILLDTYMVAHVGDFGLAKLLFPELLNASQSSSLGVRGTIGYAAPEYGLGSDVSTKGDVYSYGIILLEMVTGKRPTDPMFQQGLNLHNYAGMALGDHVVEIMDPILLDVNGEEEVPQATSNNGSKTQAKSCTKSLSCLKSMVKIGVACSMESPVNRMDITSVIHELNSLKGIILGT